MGDTYNLESVEILFEMNTNYKYQIAVSDSPDMTQADVVVDRSSNAESVQRVTENIDRECRYVRVYVNCPASNIWPCVLEVKGVGESLNTNVALGKDATASREGSGHPASDAVDGDPSTYWTNAAMGAANWQVDLGGDYQINQVDVDFVWGDGSLMHNFTLQSSMDGNSWTDVATYSGPDKTASLQVDTLARYLRVYNLYAGDGTRDWTEIAEFCAYGSEAAEETRLDYGAPSYASSSAADSDPSYGNDGDPAKYWVPAPDDASPWWYYDAGGLYDMSNVQLTWNSEQSHRYTIDLSVDGETWTTVADHMDGSEALTLTNDDISGLARYVRISLPAGSTEGFWINSTGREASARLVTGVETLDSVEAYVGTAFEDLDLPDEISATLEGGLSTKLPVVWDEDSYRADTAERADHHRHPDDDPGRQEQRRREGFHRRGRPGDPGADRFHGPDGAGNRGPGQHLYRNPFLQRPRRADGSPLYRPDGPHLSGGPDLRVGRPERRHRREPDGRHPQRRTESDDPLR